MSTGSDSAKAGLTARPRWKRPVAWIGGVVLASLAAFLTANLTGLLDKWSAAAISTGPAIIIESVSTYRSNFETQYMVLPPRTDFTDGQLRLLNDLRSSGAADSLEWLDTLGAIPGERVRVQLILSGNRDHVVLVTNMTVNKDCGGPIGGALFVSPVGGGAMEAIQVSFDLDGPSQEPYFRDFQNRTQDFFPQRTIAFKKDEQQVILVEAATLEQYCEFTITLSILENGEEREQEVRMSDGSPFRVSGLLPYSSYESLYFGGAMCSNWVQAEVSDMSYNCPDY